MADATVFPLAEFRAAYPQFAEVSDDTVQATATAALCLVSADGCSCSDAMWMLMVAHMLHLQAAIAGGTGAGGPVTSSTIDKVSVTIAAPPVGSSAYKFWLYGSPYGAQLAAMLASCGAGGVYVGSLPERAAFRSVGGVFPGRGRWLR